MAATRDAPADMARGWGSDLSGLRAVFYCAPAMTVTDVSIDEVVRQALDRHAEGIDLVGPSEWICTRMMMAGIRHNFDEIRVRQGVDV